MSPEIKALIEKRAKCITDANAILAKTKAEGRDFNADEAEQFDRAHNEADELTKRIEREERAAKAEASLRSSNIPAEVRNGIQGGSEPSSRKPDEILSAAYRKYLCDPTSLDADESIALRAQSQTLNSGGGFLVAPNTSFYARIAEAMKQYGVDESLFTVVNTGDTGDLPIPTNDDTSNTGSSLTENVSSPDATDLTFGQVTLYAHLHTTNMLKVSNKLLTGADFAEAFIARKLGERAGRVRATQLTVGSGTAGRPRGVVTASTLGRTASSASALSFRDLTELVHSVDPAYRANARLMLNDSSWKALKLLTDSDGRPLYQPSFAGASPGTFDGYQIVVNQDMASIGTGNRSVLFGDFSKYVVRNAGGLIFRRTEERYIEAFQTGFILFWMFDGNLPDTGAIKHIVHP